MGAVWKFPRKFAENKPHGVRPVPWKAEGSQRGSKAARLIRDWGGRMRKHRFQTIRKMHSPIRTRSSRTVGFSQELMDLRPVHLPLDAIRDILRRICHGLFPLCNSWRRISQSIGEKEASGPSLLRECDARASPVEPEVKTLQCAE